MTEPRIDERVVPAAEHVAALALERLDSMGLVLLPDSLSPLGKELVAGFRPEAQDLRVAAIEGGIAVDVALPEGAKAGHYTEHAADWVLPLILGVPTSVVATLIATHLQRRLDAWRSSGPDRLPVVRYREVHAESPDGPVRVREIEGPADEVLDWLREERGALPSPDDPGTVA